MQKVFGIKAKGYAEGMTVAVVRAMFVYPFALCFYLRTSLV